MNLYYLEGNVYEWMGRTEPNERQGGRLWVVGRGVGRDQPSVDPTASFIHLIVRFFPSTVIFSARRSSISPSGGAWSL